MGKDTEIERLLEGLWETREFLRSDLRPGHSEEMALAFTRVGEASGYIRMLLEKNQQLEHKVKQMGLRKMAWDGWKKAVKVTGLANHHSPQSCRAQAAEAIVSQRTSPRSE